jgi:hypothetical protein
MKRYARPPSPSARADPSGLAIPHRKITAARGPVSLRRRAERARRGMLLATVDCTR